MEAQAITNQQLAIVGMDIYFNACESLAAFERSIYEGSQIAALHSDKKTFSASSQLKSIFQVASNALQDARISKGTKITVIVATEQDSLVNSIVNQIGDYLNYSTPILQADSVFKAIDKAQELLVSKKVDTILIIASTDNETVGALVVKLSETAKQEQNRIYAMIAAIAFSSEGVQACQEAFERAQIEPQAISYLDICSNSTADNSEIRGAIAAYQTSEAFNCALGKVTNIGVVSEIASIIKTSLCLYFRYIPAFPDWSTPEDLELWQISPFYIASQSKPWFLEAGANERVAAINSTNQDGTYVHSILVEDSECQEYYNSDLEQKFFYLLPLAASDRTSLEQKLYRLQKLITDSDSLFSLVKENLNNYQQSGDLPYAIVILGKNKRDLLREIDRAWKGVAQAFETGQDWQTPLGSCFTVNPQGKKGKIAYVYPGAYNAHLGLGRNLFRLFPQLFDDVLVQSTRNRLAKLAKLLYPRSLTKLSRKQLETKEKELLDDPLAMLESETGFAGLMTTVLREYFQVKPQGSFGYSLGEISAMYSQGVWTDVAQSSDQLNASSLFKNRLAGAKNAVREYWQLPPATGEDAEIWGTYVLMTSATAVHAQIKHRSRVYLTQISTPKEVVIAGDPQACKQLIKDLNCDSFRAPFNHVIHCEAMASEYHELVRLHTLPVQTKPATKFYSAAQYQPINYDSQAIAQNLSQTLCQQLDFPRLVNQVYQDNFRIFIEVGAGSNCSRWIGEILKSQEHLTVSLNRRGIDDHVSLLKALAKLVSHRVELDLSPLYGRVKTKSNNSINTTSSNSNQDSFVPQPSLENQFKFSEKLSKDNSKLLKNHTDFLQSRQTYSDDSSELIMLQFALLQRQYIQQ